MVRTHGFGGAPAVSSKSPWEIKLHQSPVPAVKDRESYIECCLEACHVAEFFLAWDRKEAEVKMTVVVRYQPSMYLFRSMPGVGKEKWFCFCQ